MSAHMKYWDEVRTVAKVARVGTVSAASKELGIHRATVQRHVEQMEAALGTKLFLKHARGYTPTEAALELRRVAESTEEEIDRIARRIQLTDGDFESSVTLTASPPLRLVMVEVVKEICLTYPKLRLNFLSEHEVVALEKGDADIAVRAGGRPENPDYVVQPLEQLDWALYASPTYVARHGLPKTKSEFTGHYFVGPASKDPVHPGLSWIAEHVPHANIVIRSNDAQFLEECVLEGGAIGFLNDKVVSEQHGFTKVMDPEPKITTHLWLVTHVDQHRRPKIQACLKAIKSVFQLRSHRPE
ncbi:MAG: LysR family transcriptional regulator [Pseudomonadota bacterium]